MRRGAAASWLPTGSRRLPGGHCEGANGGGDCYSGAWNACLMALLAARRLSVLLATSIVVSAATR